jgi:hypothetical protein
VFVLTATKEWSMRAFVFAVLALAACAQPAGGPAPEPAPQSSEPQLAQRIREDLARLDRELAADGVVSAGIGETADLGEGLRVRPLEVIEDSRCPLDVTCVWAGRVRLRASISGAEHELTLGEPLTTPRGVVVLAVVKPSSWSDWPSEAGPRPEQRFGFRRG